VDNANSSPPAAPPDDAPTADSSPPLPAAAAAKEEEDEEEPEKDPECKDLLPPVASPISSIFQRLVDLDVAATKALAVSATPASPLGCLRPVFKLLEFSCHGVPWLLLAVTLLIIGADTSLARHAHLLLLLLGDLVLVGLTKAVFRRPRPAINIEDDVLTVSVDKYSFPSGHATRATLLLLYLCVSYYATDAVCQSVIVGWAFCVIISRVIIGRHHVTDVISGCLIGVLVFAHVAPLLTPASLQLAQLVTGNGVNQREWILARLPDCVGGYI